MQLLTNFKLALLLLSLSLFSKGPTLKDYLNVVKNGTEPIAFVEKQLKTHDLIIFDDALHNAVEPFEFYERLLSSKNNNIEYVFIEVFGINTQPQIDAFLKSSTKEFSLLENVFQNEFSGYGWRYQTYLDLLSTIWDLNQSKTEQQKIKVTAVDQPIYWEGIHTREDYNLFQKSLTGRDYFMYKTIVSKMNKFKDNTKGIFLTNTRHAYKHIKNSSGVNYWNCGTFFNQWHPNKTYSIRIHNAILSITGEKTSKGNNSTQGLDKISYKWIQMENGIWDEAFQKNDNKAVGFSLKDNAFGNATYTGNHMLKAAKEQTMYDAYDGLIFLAPLNELHFSAKFDFIYTPEFKKELKRRIEILEGDNIKGFLSDNNVKSIEEFIDNEFIIHPKVKNSLIKH